MTPPDRSEKDAPARAHAWLMRLPVDRLRDLSQPDAGTKLLIVLGLLLTVSFFLNRIQTFEDLWWPAKFERYIADLGYAKSIWMVFSGADMPTEYRTYALSRLVHFFIWSVAGEKSVVFPITIALTQLASSICLLHLLRRHRLNEDAALAVAVIWLISPFLATWSFHRYSYLVLPFQLVIATCTIIDRIGIDKRRYFVAATMGIACALTGEMYLLAGPIAIIASALAFKSKEKLRLSLVAMAAMVAALTAHRLVWATFYKSVTETQRFDSAGTMDRHELVRRSGKAIESVINSAQLQIAELKELVNWESVLFGILVATAYVWAARRDRRLDFRSSNMLLGLIFGALGCAALAIYFGVTILSGQISEIMLRRYGHVSLTLLLICVVLCTNALLTRFAFKARLTLVASIFAVSCLAFSMHGNAINATRTSDRLLISKMAAAKVAGDSRLSKGVLFYVSSNPQYEKSLVASDSPGPMMDGPGSGGGREEILESPFSIFWTADYYSTRLLGFKFVGVPNAYIEDGKVDFAGYDGIHHPNTVGKIYPQEAVVVANLGFATKDPLGQNIRVFDNFSDFTPYYFSRRIERGLPAISGEGNWTAIDLGRTDARSESKANSLPDRIYSDDSSKMENEIVERYGLIAGDNSVYDNSEVSITLPYYRTNRNGSFTYSVSLKSAGGSAEIALDFWEQWQWTAGRRMFDVEVSWDSGKSWATLGSLDIFSINGREPMSIILKRRGAKEFQFRTSRTPGSSDIPMIQGIRIRKSQ